MIAAKGDAAFAGSRAGDANRYGHGFPATSGVTHASGPRVQFEQQVGQLQFVRRNKLAVRPGIDPAFDSAVYVPIRVPKNNRAGAGAKIEIMPPVEVPNLAARTTREVG